MLCVMLLSLMCCLSSYSEDMNLRVVSKLGPLGKYISVDGSVMTITLEDAVKNGEKCVEIIPTIPVNVIKSIASDDDLNFWIHAEILDRNSEELSSYNFEIESEWDNKEECHYLKAGKHIAKSYMGYEKKSEVKKEIDLLRSALRAKGAYVVLTPYETDPILTDYK